jgi:hypothetical protein
MVPLNASISTPIFLLRMPVDLDFRYRITLSNSLPQLSAYIIIMIDHTRHAVFTRPAVDKLVRFLTLSSFVMPV